MSSTITLSEATYHVTNGVKICLPVSVSIYGDKEIWYLALYASEKTNGKGPNKNR
jgi:hypothetical protein